MGDVQGSDFGKRRVLVVENHPFFRENLLNWIASQEDLEAVAEAATISDAIDAVHSSHPDLVLLDLNLDGESSGLDFLRWLRGQDSRLFVIVLSQYEEQRFADIALEAGARGYVSKAAATDELQPAINAVLNGQFYVSGRGAFACEPEKP
jgi:DNA-binding NarL/FixJ family response regulator